MVYYEINKVKDRVGISQADPTFDDILNDFGLASDGEVDDKLYKWASKNRRLTALPVVPLANPPQNIRDASTNLVIAKWWRRQQNWTAATTQETDANDTIMQYIERLKVDIIHYMTLV